jgi:REP element-mobilizing transposase RayT
MKALRDLITSNDPEIRNQSLDAMAASLSGDELLRQCTELDAFRRRSENLYERVRALFFLYAIHRFHLPSKLVARHSSFATGSLIPFRGFEQLLHRRFEEALESFLDHQDRHGPSDAICSAIAATYQRLAFQTLADQVRHSVRSVRGNQWMFRMGHPADQPLRIRPELMERTADGTYPILRERTPVRMDLTHCGWSDIFFLGMDYPEGAKVLNVSIDLGVHGRDAAPRPPVEAYLRVLDEPVLRLTSVDLGATTDIIHLAEVFDFAKDYLGLLKAAVIAAGIVPPGIEGSGHSLAELLGRILGPGRGLELVSCVNDIPKGSRLAVSTNLLAALVSVCMRATGQAASTTGPLQESERRLVLARALLGEWLGGSGGGWQDSGGVWPGMKLIEGVLASEGDPEYGISRGRLMPQHRILNPTDASAETRRRLQDSLVLVHGGMAQNVGPILEMVTEKYLLRCGAEWTARQGMLGILGNILEALRRGDVPAIGRATTRNFRGPIQAIIPWATNHFTETVLERVSAAFGADFWGFWMLGGMSGGGMGFIFAPQRKAEAQARLQEIMSAAKGELEHALPFAMDPVVYDFAINESGTCADLLTEGDALMPANYYALTAPRLLRLDRHELPGARRAELDKFGAAARSKPELRGMVQTLFDVLLPRGKAESTAGESLDALLERNGFDRAQHEQIRADLKEGRIGLAQNRLPANAVIEDVQPRDVLEPAQPVAAEAPVQECQMGGGAPAPLPLEADTPGLQRDLDRRGAGALACPGPVVAPPAGPPTLPSANPFTSFDSTRAVTIHRRRLPHWFQEGCTYFVTFRLADSLPSIVLDEWRRERDAWLSQVPQPVSPRTLEEARALFSARFEDHLDAGHGTCLLRDPDTAAEVERCLRHRDGRDYSLGSFVIMPNHVHAVLRPAMGHSLPEILQAWKSVTAHKLNQRLGREGPFWQDESFDHLVRDEHQLERFARYIEDNPARAGLAGGGLRMGIGTGGRSAPQLEPARDGRPAGRRSEPAAGGAPAPLPSSAPLPASAQAFSSAPPPSPVSLQLQAPALSVELCAIGLNALKKGEVAVVTLAAGAGSRWTGGAGTCKALHPYCKLGGQHRTFIETHLAKSRRVSRAVGAWLPHVFTTSYLTHEPIAEFLVRVRNYGYEGPLRLSPGRSVGLRLVPTERDLRFLWEEMPQQLLDEQQQKVRDSLRGALIDWARGVGEAGDYTDNAPLQCLHPVGHFYEVPNLFRNGVLAQLLKERPQLSHLFLHNIDTLGADVDPGLLGTHIQSGACLTFEVITRRLEDRGGGLARVNGRVRLVEGLALPREEDEFNLSFYNSNSCWIHLDRLLAAFGLTRDDILSRSGATACPGPAGTPPAETARAAAQEKVAAAIRSLASKLPTYVTLKEVKKRWGHGQEDVFPITQFERLWVDLTALPEIESRFVVVPRLRGQQLKDPAQLDGWLRDGSAAYVESLCDWT